MGLSPVGTRIFKCLNCNLLRLTRSCTPTGPTSLLLSRGRVLSARKRSASASPIADTTAAEDMEKSSVVLIESVKSGSSGGLNETVDATASASDSSWAYQNQPSLHLLDPWSHEVKETNLFFVKNKLFSSYSSSTSWSRKQSNQWAPLQQLEDTF